ncbi:hypothetical protein SanaruYs_00790 [Chryseotalea sanaruensis]|uniref:Uncharacterized protein n=1 Tax=Chryseotalea sanaruensis TaxID=2482724 RepID=A0A401U4S8_9BACT|nr:hypothetical protein [Chryseotalea sanaruensis]GCC49865.1 hypothetical protein SanaruYs_00790 [Chryseotalea sanaruensis]
MSRINNYEELLATRKLLEAKIESEKAILKGGLIEVREKLEPFMHLLPVLNIFKKNEKRNSLLKGAASLGIDVVFGQALLKTSWITRLLLPMLLKGVSSKLIGGKRKVKFSENGH